MRPAHLPPAALLVLAAALALGCGVPADPAARALPRGPSFQLPMATGAVPAAAPGAPGLASMPGADPHDGSGTDAPASAPQATPMPGASPPAAPAAAPPGRGGSGGGSGGSGGGRPAPASPAPMPEPPRLPVAVVDEYGAPVAGATVRFGDGTEVVSDADGGIGVWPAFAGQRAAVSAEGFVPSMAFDLASADRLHLRRLEGPSPPYADRATTLIGALAGADGPPASAWVRYAGDPAATSRVIYQTPEGNYALPIVTTGPGTPRGVLVSEATTAGGELAFGLSPAFAPFADPVPAVAFVAATRRIAFAIVDAPADLGLMAARCELARADGPPIVLAATPDRAGSFAAVPDGAWAGTRTRVVLTARAGGGLRESLAAVVPADDRAEASLLDPPAVAVDDAARQVTWTAVAGAKAYRVEARVAGAGLAWEAVTTDGLAMTVPEAAWPAAGGELVVQAIDAPAFASRSLAALAEGPRRLRIEPWTGAATYRVATTRVPR